MDDAQIRSVRSFNRAVTRRIGVLTDDYLGRGRPWGESRLMFEIGRDGASARELRERLALDSGYLSRLLRSLEAQKLVTSRPSPHDARVRMVTLTRKGLRELDAMDGRSDDVAATLLGPLTPTQRQRLVAAMAEVEWLLRVGTVTIDVADPASPAATACIAAYVQELRLRIPAFDPGRGPTASADELVPPNGLLLLASLDGAAVGCAALKSIAPGVGEIKRMWVAPALRGAGIARRLLVALEAHAVGMGMPVLRLDTAGTQAEALALYRHRGYREIAAYNDNPYADHWFEKRIGTASEASA